MTREKSSSPGRKAPRTSAPKAASPRVRRRQRTATAAVKKGATLMQFEPRRNEIPGVFKSHRPVR